MNKISFDTYLTERSVAILIRIFIDDGWLDGLNEAGIEVKSLKDTLSLEGLNILSIYDCECDRPEHNKYIYVEVEHCNDRIEWKNFYSFYHYIDEKNLSKEELEKRIIKIVNTPLVFDKNQYYEAIKNLEFIYRFFEKRRNFIVSEEQLALRTDEIKEILRLSKSPYISILRCLALNKNTSTEILKYIYQKKCDPWLAEEIILHPNCSLNLFQKILNELGDQISIPNYKVDELSEEKKEIFKKTKRFFLK